MPGPVKPAAVRIRLPYQTVQEFAEGYRHHLSRAAAFIATDGPRTVGTILQFEFVLASGEQVLRGEAVVAKDPRPPSRPGMLLRFLSLDDPSRELIEKICPPLANGAEVVVLGIDFGGSASRVAVTKRGKTNLLALGRDNAVPSVVGVDEHGRIVLGAAAQALVVSHPDRVVVGPKRLLGRSASAESASITARLPFPVTADARGELAAVLGGQPYPLTRLAAEILRGVREKAQDTLGFPVQRAVLAVPAHFGDKQRAALRRAASEAGLSVDRLVNEASAVALAYGVGRAMPRRRLAIVDLGGGSFDCSVVLVEGDEIETQACGGDSTFGGREFDARLANYLAERFEAEAGIDVADDPGAFQRLQDAAARLKITLSSDEVGYVALPFLAQRPSTGDDPRGQPVDFKTQVTRAEFEALTSDLVDRVVYLTSEVLKAGKLEPRACDDLVLIGGMAGMPLLRQKLATLFGKEPRRDVDGESAVARGAAMLGHSLTQREQGLGLREALSAPVFLELSSGELRQVFERSVALPAECHLSLDETQAGCLVRVHQGNAGATELLGTLGIDGGTGRPQLYLSLSVDGVLHARLRLGDHENSLDLLPADARSELPLALIEGLEGPPPTGSKPPGVLERILKTGSSA